MSQKRIVRSQTGLIKVVCEYDCPRELCCRAHPNYLHSIVKHPQWCLQGWTDSCTRKNCPFNHFRSEAAFVQYRMVDRDWFETHLDLVKKYNLYDVDHTLADQHVHIPEGMNTGDVNDTYTNCTMEAQDGPSYADIVCRLKYI
jgi:hypothetical protein